MNKQDLLKQLGQNLGPKQLKILAETVTNPKAAALIDMIPTHKWIQATLIAPLPRPKAAGPDAPELEVIGEHLDEARLQILATMSARPNANGVINMIPKSKDLQALLQ